MTQVLLRRGVAKLFLARRASETLGAILFAAFRGRAYSVFSGSTPDGYRLGVQSGLFWSAVRAFKSEGYEILNRGGVIGASADPAHPLHGIYRFKERLGTTPVPCRSGVKVVHPLFGLLQRLRSGGKDE